jgi:hypothetical protein
MAAGNNFGSFCPSGSSFSYDFSFFYSISHEDTPLGYIRGILNYIPVRF